MRERRHSPDRRADPCQGRRKDYQGGCRCRRCTHANSAYQRDRRAQLCRGKLPPQARVNARATWRLINQLLKAGYQKAQIARFLGLKRGILEVHPTRVTQVTAARVAQVYAEALAEEPETTLNSLNSPHDATRR